MTMKKTNSLYKILFQFNGDGSYGGPRAQYREVITDDGVVIADTLGDPVPLSFIEEGDKATVAAALGEATSALVAAKEAAEAEAAALRADNAAKDANIQALLAENEALRAAAQG